MSSPQTVSAREDGDRLMSDDNEYKTSWSEYYDILHTTDPSCTWLLSAGVWMLAAYPLISDSVPSIC